MSNEKTGETSEDKVRVYYNSACPVCDAGIERQKHRTVSCDVEWNDIHSDDAKHRDVSNDREFVRKRLHAVDGQGNVRVGMDAITLLWRHSPHERWKAWVVSLPGIRQLAHVTYNVFALMLYKWNRWKKHW